MASLDLFNLTNSLPRREPGESDRDYQARYRAWLSSVSTTLGPLAVGGSAGLPPPTLMNLGKSSSGKRLGEFTLALTQGLPTPERSGSAVLEAFEGDVPVGLTASSDVNHLIIGPRASSGAVAPGVRAPRDPDGVTIKVGDDAKGESVLGVVAASESALNTREEEYSRMHQEQLSGYDVSRSASMDEFLRFSSQLDVQDASMLVAFKEPLGIPGALWNGSLRVESGALLDANPGPFPHGDPAPPPPQPGGGSPSDGQGSGLVPPDIGSPGGGPELAKERPLFPDGPLLAGGAGCPASLPPLTSNLSFPYGKRTQEEIRTLPHSGCIPGVAPRRAFDDGAGLLPTETPSAADALSWSKKDGNDVVPRGTICVPQFTFALFDNDVYRKLQEPEILKLNPEGSTRANYNWWILHRDQVGSIGDATVTINRATFYFINAIEIRGLNLGSCLWRQVIVSKQCFSSKGGVPLSPLLGGWIVPMTELRSTCKNAVDFGWYHASEKPIVRDEHQPSSARSITSQKFDTWNVHRARFIVQAYCMRTGRVVKQFSWGYEYRNFDPVNPPVQAGARGTVLVLAPFAQERAEPVLRLWLGQEPANLWMSYGIKPSTSGNLFIRTSETTSGR